MLFSGWIVLRKSIKIDINLFIVYAHAGKSQCQIQFLRAWAGIARVLCPSVCLSVCPV